MTDYQFVTFNKKIKKLDSSKKYYNSIFIDKEERRKEETKCANESIASMMRILRKLPAEVRQQAENFVESLATKYLRVNQFT